MYLTIVICVIKENNNSTSIEIKKYLISNFIQFFLIY